MIEKLEQCPRCAEVGKWVYDAQICRGCYYPDRYREIMRAEQSPDMYAGENCDEMRSRWVGSADGDKDGDGEIGPEIVLDAGTFPPGTRVRVEMPECPQCRTPRELCDCGFDWASWDARYA